MCRSRDGCGVAPRRRRSRRWGVRRFVAAIRLWHRRAGSRQELRELSDHTQFRAAAPMRESETFQFELGRIAAELRAARAFHRAQVASHWRHALAGTLRDETLFAEGTQTGIWVATTCVRVADACFTLAGGSAVYERSPLQRRMRDLHAAAQHATIQQRHYVAAGKAALQCGRQSEGPPRLAAQ
jgi:alkylation response protein AidB-like acyl-CoA dehydrogenase